MTAPEWAKDEQSLEEAKSYLRQGNTVDFYEQVASCILREHPADLALFCRALVADLRVGKIPRHDGEFQPKKEEDNKYMRAHNVSEFLDRWILALLAARPATDAERLDWHQQYIDSLVSASK